MKKYLAFYETEWPANIAELTAVKNKPFVGCLKGKSVQYTVIPKPVVYDPYVTFTAQEDNSSISLYRLSTNHTLEYSTDSTTWETFNTETHISLNNGDKVYVRGVLSSDNKYNNYTNFEMTGKIAASGNCNALWNYQDLSAPLKQYCGYYMFRDCAALTTTPELPAITLATYCYSYMFNNCTSLTTTPKLPAPELTMQCYNYMFGGCTSLNHITCLATDRSAWGCTTGWVSGVSSTGTFIKHPDMNSWSTSVEGIPSGWTVVDAEL